MLGAAVRAWGSHAVGPTGRVLRVALQVGFLLHAHAALVAAQPPALARGKCTRLADAATDCARGAGASTRPGQRPAAGGCYVILWRFDAQGADMVQMYQEDCSQAGSGPAAITDWCLQASLPQALCQQVSSCLSRRPVFNDAVNVLGQ